MKLISRLIEAIKAVIYLSRLPAHEWDYSDGTVCTDEEAS
jgi:hypothetical protein